nr:ABC-F family ATP-binding cassette domain-containing protein [Pantoea sp. 201603H]
MTYISVQSVSYENSNIELFQSVSFAVQKGDRIGLIGYNGTGKSTLLKILNGEISPHSGNVITARECIIARVEQELEESLHNQTVVDCLLEQLPARMKEGERWRCELLLGEMDFTSEQQNLNVGSLSGGQHTRLLLARALFKEPDLLLLDEPSNHMDLPTLLWLEKFLLNWKGSFVLVSHDSQLLDKVTTSTLILRDQSVQLIRLGCTAARQLLDEYDESDAERFHAEKKEIERVEKSAKRLAEWGRVYDNEGLARKSIEMIKRANRLREEQTVLTDGSKWKLSLYGVPLDADRLLEFPTLSIRPTADAEELFRINGKQIKSGDRIAIMGSNGTGKTTLLKHIWNSYKEKIDGSVKFHPNIHIGYYDQTLDQLSDNDSLIEALSRYSNRGSEANKIALISAGFEYSRHQQKVSLLSGGERSRLLFVALSLAEYSLLMLDEPTNHLDLEGKEQLEEALKQYKGALLMVSHDRQISEKTCNRYWMIKNKKLSEYNNFSDLYRYIFDKDEDVVLSEVDTPESDNYNENADEDEDELLERLMSLENKLSNEKERKPKHQKIHVQTRLIEEIELIKKALNM